MHAVILSPARGKLWCSRETRHSHVRGLDLHTGARVTPPSAAAAAHRSEVRRMLAAALLNVALVVPTSKITMTATSTVADDVLRSLQELAPAESTIDGRCRGAARGDRHAAASGSSTCAAADELQALLGDPSDDGFCAIFDRVLRDGNWAGAAACAASRRRRRPARVVPFGNNGIRKTTSVYQPWFKPARGQPLGVDEFGACAAATASSASSTS